MIVFAKIPFERFALLVESNFGARLVSCFIGEGDIVENYCKNRLL